MLIVHHRDQAQQPVEHIRLGPTFYSCGARNGSEWPGSWSSCGWVAMDPDWFKANMCHVTLFHSVSRSRPSNHSVSFQLLLSVRPSPGVAWAPWVLSLEILRALGISLLKIIWRTFPGGKLSLYLQVSIPPKDHNHPLALLSLFFAFSLASWAVEQGYLLTLVDIDSFWKFGNGAIRLVNCERDGIEGMWRTDMAWHGALVHFVLLHAQPAANLLHRSFWLLLSLHPTSQAGASSISIILLQRPPQVQRIRFCSNYSKEETHNIYDKSVMNS